MKIIINNLKKKLGNELVLDNVSIEFESGVIYGLVGRNGSGKSMLLKTICGFIKPDGGEVIVNNEDIYAKKTFPKSTAALIETPSFLPDLTGFENLKLLASIRNEITDEEIFKTLEIVNLDKEKNKKFKKYSLGMKQKLGIAQVLMENPSIIILDEPFNGLDNESSILIRNVLLQEKNNDKIIIIATHIKEDIEKLCDKIYKMDAGKIENSN